MNTRRSWRNQNRLFRDLFEPPAAPPASKVELLERALSKAKADPFAGRRTVQGLERELAQAKRAAAVRAAREVKREQHDVDARRRGCPFCLCATCSKWREAP